MLSVLCLFRKSTYLLIKQSEIFPYPNIFFCHFRTTTPNSLREHLKETLTKNLGGSASDIAETIEHFKNDEILDTFNIDNENVESPPVQRKAFRYDFTKKNQ